MSKMKREVKYTLTQIHIPYFILILKQGQYFTLIGIKGYQRIPTVYNNHHTIFQVKYIITIRTLSTFISATFFFKKQFCSIHVTDTTWILLVCFTSNNLSYIYISKRTCLSLSFSGIQFQATCLYLYVQWAFLYHVQMQVIYYNCLKILNYNLKACF